jgi:hypothetical protein
MFFEQPQKILIWQVCLSKDEKWLYSNNSVCLYVYAYTTLNNPQNNNKKKPQE